eukprot:TRINITY_DN6946_c0_g1_i1.p1 TRINITY_DN6946_c0_g1~~TRINITY_DN6946_c0_g1_i1.p1  ORF type:complete len:138 (-),score=16.73 TRINITY_DN6946_c0_g1_i1:167-580(-)
MATPVAFTENSGLRSRRLVHSPRQAGDGDCSGSFLAGLRQHGLAILLVATYILLTVASIACATVRAQRLQPTASGDHYDWTAMKKDLRGLLFCVLGVQACILLRRRTSSANPHSASNSSDSSCVVDRLSSQLFVYAS